MKYALPTMMGIMFFVVSLITLTHYGINWDTINHLPRGQAYLNFFLTGKRDFSNLPPFERYWQDPDKLGVSSEIKSKPVVRSLYQSDGVDFNWIVENDGNGHPPVSDILSSLTNYVFFQKLRIINDIDAYRLYSVFLASFLIFLVVHWSSRIYGKTVGVLSGIFLATYPLFWSESHFNNEKDIPETFFWTSFLFCVWKGLKERNWKWVLFAGIPFGLAIGTKFNILFALPIVAILFLVNKIKTPPFYIAFAVSMFIAVIIFVGFWPYLWPDIVGRSFGVFMFYKGIGTTQNANPAFLGPFGINLYPVKWILYTSPIPILLTFLMGIFLILKKVIKKDWDSLLFLLWFFIPLARVTLPNTTIYGGIRQIMEFIPAMAVIAAIGAGYIINKKPNPLIVKAILLFIFLIISLQPIIKYHPYENTYFNFLVGGIKGAKENDIPSWGNTFGSAYRPVVSWINYNAPNNSKAVFARSIIPNVPLIWFRKDIDIHNSHRSGTLANGEYAFDLNFQGTGESSFYDRYLNNFLRPVYQTGVDGVFFANVWENDKKYLKSEYSSIVRHINYLVTRNNDVLKIDLKKIVSLSDVIIHFNRTNSCKDLKFGIIKLSNDGMNWYTKNETLPNQDWGVPLYGNQPLTNSLFIAFPAEEARYVQVVANPADSCILNAQNIEVNIFENQ